MRCFKMWWLYVTVVTYLTNLTTGEESTIIIVGAGAAGIAAASKLYENGFQDIIILEAENRIGGRVFTTWFDRSWVDLGGQWVHGQTNNIAFELAEPFGLLEVPQPAESPPSVVYDSKGCQIPNKISDELFRLFFQIQDKVRDGLEGKNSSIGEYFTEMITNEYIAKYPAANQTLLRQFMKLFEGFQNAVDASENWYDTSARGYVEYWECPGSHSVNWKDRGYGTILDILMKRYPNPGNELPVRNNTKLNFEVVKIDYNSTEGKVSVESNNGEKYTADHVIVTPSLGVLKHQHESLFMPKLPESKVRTIKGLSMGTVAKIFVSFETRWWPKEPIYFQFMWSENERREYSNDPDKKWWLDLFGFFPVEYRPRILCGWINAPGARYMETLPEDQVLKEMLTILDKFLGRTYNITKSTGFLRSSWYSNKHFRGTYSFRSMESEAANVWAGDLAAPLIINEKPVVMFAGEATHPHYYSTVHGAIESGFREANRLINIYNRTITDV